MAYTKEQAEEIKEQLLKQIERLPKENQESIKEHILSLDEEQLEEFIKNQTKQEDSSPKCIFCSIINNETPSYKIAETKKAIAILEINPLSKGHSIILPLEHTTIDKIEKSALTLAYKIAKKIKAKFNPEDIKIETSSFQGHSLINVIPMYKDKKLEKTKASEEELKELQSILQIIKRAPRTKRAKKAEGTIEEIIEKLPKISFRIP
ncbi:MAG: HIT domain-containing protein [Nanoarchaeota archaeon]